MAAASPSITARAVERSLSARKRDWLGQGFQVLLLLSLLLALAIIVFLLSNVLGGAWRVWHGRGTDFLTQGGSRDAEAAGVWQGIRGTLTLVVFVVVLAFPIGIATAVYLEEYARDNVLTKFISVNIRNLTGVPSVVFGLLGLAVFVRTFGLDRGDDGGFTGGKTVISAGLTLTVLVLPIVIITAAEAIRAVPGSIREAGYGVGASRWEVTRSLVLPSAAPGILTGTVLAISRAMGEAAPILLVGANTGFFSSGNQSFFEQLQGTFTALPAVIFGWARETSEFRDITAAAIFVLLMITVLANGTAIWLRNRFEKQW
jgi:phosphate transport system permease protein